MPRKASRFTTTSAETTDPTTITTLAPSIIETAENSMVDAVGIRILNLDEDMTGESIPDLILTLGRTQEICDTGTAVESALSTAATGRLLSGQCSSSVVSGARNDGKDGNGDRNDANNVDNESIPSTSGNYLHEWTPQYSSSISIFATLSSGNFLSENEITDVFSRCVNITNER